MDAQFEASAETTPVPVPAPTPGLAGLLMPNAVWQPLPDPEAETADGGGSGPRRKFLPPEGGMHFPHRRPE